MPIDDPESITAAGSQKEIMPARGVFDHIKHDIASIGIKRVAFGKQNRFGIVYRSSGGKIF